jgi:hypothetical protein
MGYQLIETVTVGAGGATSIEFTEIPQDGVDLVVLTSVRVSSGTGASRIAEIQFNGDVNNNYPNVYLQGSASVVSSGGYNFRGLRHLADSSSQTSNTFSSGFVYISNYTSSNQKSVSIDSVTETNATDAQQMISAGQFTQTSPITSLRVYAPDTAVQYSTASLYSIS